jgi:hypothetical protein
MMLAVRTSEVRATLTSLTVGTEMLCLIDLRKRDTAFDVIILVELREITWRPYEVCI